MMAAHASLEGSGNLNHNVRKKAKNDTKMSRKRKVKVESENDSGEEFNSLSSREIKRDSKCKQTKLKFKTLPSKKQEQKDAFEVMMNSRNKVIGSNSPGKEDVKKVECLIEKQMKADMKASVKMKLQAMAEKKSSKKKFNDEDRDELIKYEMDKRAKRLKKMITNGGASKIVKEKTLVDVANTKCQLKVTPMLQKLQKSETKKKLKSNGDNSHDCLSPKNKKKESMFSYFNKVENTKKEASSSAEKVKKKRSKLSLRKSDQNEEPMTEKICETSFHENTGRPRRSIRRPLKYVIESDSDSAEDCNFSKRRTKTSVMKIPKPKSEKNPETETVHLNSSDESTVPVKHTAHKTNGKLAPLFVPKRIIDPAITAARKEFLQSGMPDQMKKIIEKQQIPVEMLTDAFFAVCHVRQIPECEDEEFDPWNLAIVHRSFIEDCDEMDTADIKSLRLTDLMNQSEVARDFTPINTVSTNSNQLLKIMKNAYTEFPFYRTFKLLREQCKNSQPEVWVEKYRPVSTSNILGNRKSVTFLKSWLDNWKEYCDGLSVNTGRSTRTSMSSDDFYPSESESRDSAKTPENVLVISGPQGCGKTSAIYATANELGIKVLEINASSKRTGKRFMSELQEATQSHKVIRSQLSNSESLSQLFNENTQNSEHASGQCMSMILVEDAEVVFDQDDGFIAALAQIVQYSKRPVLLVTSDLACPHLQRFITENNVVRFSYPNPKVIAAWLSTMCLVENTVLASSICQYLLECNEGDVRKTIHQLQFLIQGNGPTELPTSDQATDAEHLTVDEVSNISWPEQALGLKAHTVVSIRPSYFDCFIEISKAYGHKMSHYDFTLPQPLKTKNIWWNTSSLLETIDAHKTNLSVVSKAVQNMSDIEYLNKTGDDCYNKFWETTAVDSVSEDETFSQYVWYEAVSSSLTHFMLSSNLQILKGDGALEGFDYDLALPRLDNLRQYAQVSKANKSLCEVVPSTHCLQRGSLAMDYLPALRTICRNEKDRQDTNMKRNNRFSHYLKSLGHGCKENDYNIICRSLNVT